MLQNSGRLTATVRALAAFVVAIAVSALTAGAAKADITGAGATFPAPIYTKWAELYAATGGERLNYQAIGSGAGVTQIINRTVDFGASDTPVAADRLASQNLLQFPAIVGGVVVVVNLPGVDGANLKLTGPLIAEMYIGRLRMWNDRRIAAINPGVKLPAVAVAPVYRADSSGTTNLFTTYLAAVNPTFSTQVGAANSVNWRSGIGAPGNAGVAGAVKNTRGGVGYVEYAYATQNRMQTPMLQNRAGVFVKPNEAAFVSAAAQADWARAQNFAVSMINMAGAPTWPIVGATYILIPKNPANAQRAASALKFFDWAFKSGGPSAVQLHYIMLPEAVRASIRTHWAQVRVGGKPVYAPAAAPARR